MMRFLAPVLMVAVACLFYLDDGLVQRDASVESAVSVWNGRFLYRQRESAKQGRTKKLSLRLSMVERSGSCWARKEGCRCGESCL